LSGIGGFRKEGGSKEKSKIREKVGVGGEGGENMSRQKV